jgi:protein-S-isoprenylcysteine O-methyltransferase Ste14
MPAAYLACVVLYIGGLLVRDAYELLKKADRVDTTNPRIFGVVFTAMCVMWLAWFAMGVLDPMRLEVAAPLRYLGLCAVVVGLILAVGGVWQLKGLENVDHLVTTGLFRRIRHPMYVGFILWIVGWSAFQGAVLSLAIGSLGLVSIAWWRHLEELALEASYGSAYMQYRATSWC